MNKDNRTGSRLFFIEFLIVLFFFLIVSTVCLRLFARAHMITQRADALSHAQAAAASAAAAVEAAVTGTEISARADDRTDTSDILTAAARYLPGASVSDGVLTIAYDEDYQVCAAGEARYMLTMQTAPTQDGTEISIAVRDSAEESVHEPAAGSQQPVYELTVSFHRPMTREEALQ